MSIQTPDSVEAIQTCVQEYQQLRVVGNRTKTGLIEQSSDAAQISLSQLTGIIEYEPAEYTFTAYAGTPVHEVQEALRENQQYLPCDPLLVEAGATLGGSLAANLSGSRRYRYGGLRDFILGLRVVDGVGQHFRCGGKVVKNSAGFDLPKFFVGSLGAYGLITEATFKVFPEPPVFKSVRLPYPALSDVLDALYYLNQQPFELDALDIEQYDGQWVLLARFGGTAAILPERLKRFVTALAQHSAVETHQSVADDAAIWQAINALCGMRERQHVVKISLSPRQILALDAHLEGTTRRYSVGGNIAWVGTDDLEALAQTLTAQGLTGLHVLGSAGPALIGTPIDNPIAGRVKAVLDPDNTFI